MFNVERTDEELLSLLGNTNHAWAVRGPNLFSMAESLGDALNQVEKFGHRVVQLIVRLPDDNIHIEAEQIVRLLRN